MAGPTLNEPTEPTALSRPGWRPALTRNPMLLVGLGGVLALLLPALLLGPWLPLVDLVGFVGMYSYPAQLSYGPLHYYTFQLSYIGVEVVSRLLTDLQLPVRFQIPVYYLIQVGICFGVICGSLRRLVPNLWLRAVGVALGAIAFWDGIFLWGGPLAHSLGAACLSVATYLSIRDAAEPQRNASPLIALFAIFGVCCHPFILPFALVVCGVRFLFAPRYRWHTAVLAGALLVFGFIILHDAPASERGATGGLWLLWGVRPVEIAHRITGLFWQDALFARVLFGHVPSLSEVVFLFFGALHLIGFVVSPYLALTERKSVWLRMLATLNTAAAGLYIFSCNMPAAPISDWPLRVLTLYAPFTFLAGFVGVLHLIGRIRPAWTRERTMPAIAWAVPVGILAFAALVQAQVFRIGASLEAAIARTRDEIVKSGVTNAYLVVSGMDNVRPFYLRCVPFVLFSDQALIDRHLMLSTEWHVKARHPTRLTEAAFNIGRKRYLAEFSAVNEVMSVRLIEQPPGRFPVSERSNARTWSTPAMLAEDQFQQGLELYRDGVFSAALEHFNTAVYLSPKFAGAWNDGGVVLYEVRQFHEAVGYFQKAVNADPKFLDGWLNLASALLDDGRPAEAVPPLQEALKLDPRSARAKDLLEKANAATAKPMVPPAKH